MGKRNAPEQRTVDVDVQDIEARGRTVHGYAAVYGVESEDLGGFREVIAPGAFASVLNGDADVRALLNHDPSQILGRTKSGTLRLFDEQRGLRFELDLPESRSDLREAISRGDLDGASFRFHVGEDDWQGDLRTVKSVKQLHDISIATVPAYPSASIELRSRPSGGESRDLRVRDRTNRGSLRVEDRSSASPSLTEAFRREGFPDEQAEIPFGEFRSVTLAGGTTVDELSRREMAGVDLGADRRYVYPALPNVPVDSGVTAVNVTRQSARTLASAASVIRDIDATTAKPETSSEIEITPTALKQVASKQGGIPNVYLETDAVNSIVENDLRLAVNDGLDKLVLDALATAGFQAPGTDPLLVSIRKAITVLAAAGYNPDTLILDPANDEALDTLVATATAGEQFYVFNPAQSAPGTIFNLRKRISKGAPAPIVCDASAVGRLYTSPVSLQRFEENDGGTNTSLIRLELHALFGVERIAAARRIAAA